MHTLFCVMIFFELLQIAVGNRTGFNKVLTDEEWEGVFDLSQKQAMTGIAFLGIERLPEGERPKRELLLRWYMATERIKEENKTMDRKTLIVANRFLMEGFPSVILKGQGIARLYPNGEYRTPGDIDIWLGGRRKDIVRYVRLYSPDSLLTYHHIEFDAVRDTDIEVHFTPSWMNGYFTNRRLQEFFNMERSGFERRERTDDYTEIPVPSLDFNRVFILVHIYRHFFYEGIGLRQMLDYYYVLCHGFSEEDGKKTVDVLKSLGMIRFAGAVMYVLKNVFDMEERFMLVPANEIEGKFLLDEIMLAGNFGHHDPRVGYGRKSSAWNLFWRRVSRSSRFIFRYPSEAIWTPFFKMVNFFYWRRKWSLLA